MANSHGGYRAPTHPAGASGPGALSKRTDRGPKMMNLTDAAYGEQASFHDAQAGASMGAPGALSIPQAAPQADPRAGLIPLDAPSQRPGEPVTHGAALGPGAGPDVMGLANDPSVMSNQDLAQLRQYLPALLEMANRPDSTSSFRNYVRILKAKLT